MRFLQPVSDVSEPAAEHIVGFDIVVKLCFLSEIVFFKFCVLNAN